jgi:hypothetical protein
MPKSDNVRYNGKLPQNAIFISIIFLELAVFNGLYIPPENWYFALEMYTYMYTKWPIIAIWYVIWDDLISDKFFYISQFYSN